jgi:hypothetical protein
MRSSRNSYKLAIAAVALAVTLIAAIQPACALTSPALITLTIAGTTFGPSGVYLLGSTIQLTATLTNFAGTAMPSANITENRINVYDASSALQTNVTAGVTYAGTTGVYYIYVTLAGGGAVGQWTATWINVSNAYVSKGRVTFYVSS